MTDKLPEWPEKPEHLGLANTAYWEAYERARADAAMARLRVAVEALNQVRFTSSPSLIARTHFDITNEALAAIGPLPLPQMPTTMTGEGEGE